MGKWIQENKWFYKDEDGKVITGWVEDKEKWYYLSPTKTSEYLEGQMVTGWFQEDDKWYYLSPTKTTKYYEGEMVTGWFQDSDGRWYYFSPEKQVLNKIQYYKGQMVTGWFKDTNEKWYYLVPTSNPSEGIYKGQMIHSSTKEIDGEAYSFDENGVWKDSTSNSGLVSTKCAEFAGSWEGLSLKAYADPYYGSGVKAYWTIGYGTTYSVKPSAFPKGLNSTCTKSQALEWLKEELNSCAIKIKENLDKKGVKLSQNEFDALCDFAYNCGVGGLLGSTLYTEICKGERNATKITEYFTRWSKANGKTSQGLLKRRNAEARMFLKSDYTGNC